MRLQTFSYFIKEGAKSFKNNGLMSLASIIIVIACLIVFGIYLAFATNVQYIVEQIGSQYEVQVYIDESATPKQVAKLLADIKAVENVKDVKFVSRDDALKQYKQDLGESGSILDGFEKDNPLRDAFKIVMNDLKYSQNVVDTVQNMQYVANIRNNSSAVNTIITITDVVKKVSLVFMLILGFFSVFIISNTIKLTVFARRRDINIMKFLGATDRFIRFPFIIEGVMIGLIGSIVSFLVTIQCYSFVAKACSIFLGNIALKPFNDVLSLILILIFSFGILLGGLGSGISVRKYLKV